jgi:hypothetical protein
MKRIKDQWLRVKARIHKWSAPKPALPPIAGIATPGGYRPVSFRNRSIESPETLQERLKEFDSGRFGITVMSDIHSYTEDDIRLIVKRIETAGLGIKLASQTKSERTVDLVFKGSQFVRVCITASLHMSNSMTEAGNVCVTIKPAKDADIDMTNAQMYWIGFATPYAHWVTAMRGKRLGCAPSAVPLGYQIEKFIVDSRRPHSMYDFIGASCSIGRWNGQYQHASCICDPKIDQRCSAPPGREYDSEWVVA